MNKVILTGNLVATPELKQTQNGIAVCSFRIATQRRYAEADGTRKADFIDCVAWRKTAEFVARHFIKGNKIGVVGSIQTRSYEAQDGSRRYVTEVVLDEAEFVAPRQASEAQDAPAPGQFQEVDPGDDLPF